MMKRRTYLGLTFAVGASAVLSPLSSCIREDEQLSQDGQWALLTSLVDTILPDTDVPGALKAGVPTYIISVLAVVFTSRERNQFNRGLQEIQAFSRARYHLPFERCPEDARLDMLVHFEAKATKRIGIFNRMYLRIWGEPFILQLKRLVVVGYCTSQLGAVEGLAYDPIPIHYETCVSLSDQPRTWATE